MSEQTSGGQTNGGQANDEQPDDLGVTGGYGTPAPEDEVAPDRASGAGDASVGSDDLDAGGYGTPAPEDEAPQAGSSGGADADG